MYDMIVIQWDIVLKEEAVGQFCTKFHEMIYLSGCGWTMKRIFAKRMSFIADFFMKKDPILISKLQNVNQSLQT